MEFRTCALKMQLLTVLLPCFCQSINYNHLLPTRYALELEGLKGSVAPETFKEPSNREAAKIAIKKLFEERYLAGKNK